MNDEDSLVDAAFPHRRSGESTAYGRGWEYGINTAWDPSRSCYADDALAGAQEEVSKLAALLERMEAEGRKYYSDSTEETLDFSEQRDKYDYYRGIVDGHLDARHYEAGHQTVLVEPPRTPCARNGETR